jgi:hypothetical protein
MRIVKVTLTYFETEDERIYFDVPLKKRLTVEEMQDVVDQCEATMKRMIYTTPSSGNEGEL